ncbi:MAG: hypothetical protein LBP28_01370 [Coriobacteriales bacterium]|jgi:hypothetical protein|nr:hypothetical protein [Coriobacteriales bacterium]
MFDKRKYSKRHVFNPVLGSRWAFRWLVYNFFTTIVGSFCVGFAVFLLYMITPGTGDECIIVWLLAWAGCIILSLIGNYYIFYTDDPEWYTKKR